jgi:hypothetical protein
VMNETNKIGLNCNIKKMSYSILIKVQFRPNKSSGAFPKRSKHQPMLEHQIQTF